MKIGHCRSDRGVRLQHRGPCLQCDGQLEWMCGNNNQCINMTQLCDHKVRPYSIYQYKNQPASYHLYSF